MDRFDKAWLVVNSASGSNTPSLLDELRDCLSAHAIEVRRTIAFPEEDLPTPAALDEAGIPLVIVYTGDGTLNAAIAALDGWKGALLVLPGGTMNLLSKRLHGEYGNADIVEMVAQGGARRVRINTIHCAHGEALAGLLVGPGTAWGEVREAMRDFDIPAMASGAAEAVAETTGESMVRAADPPFGSREGYPLIEMTPGEHGIQLDGFHAETAGEYAAQGWALLRRRFREGPHDRLGIAGKVVLESADGSPLAIMIDGEPLTAEPRLEFTVATSAVDLLATSHGH